MLVIRAIYLVILLFAWNDLFGGELDGKWRFQKNVDYTAKEKHISFKLPKVFDVVGGKSILYSRCMLYFSKKKANGKEIFRSLINAGESEQDIYGFLRDAFGFDVANGFSYYLVDQSDCSDRLGVAILLSKRHMIFVRDGAAFSGYERFEDRKEIRPDAEPYGLKITPLPFSLASYLTLCLPIIIDANGVPHSTSKCAPVFYPYVASKNNKDPLSQTIGRHNYEPELLGKFQADYNDPVGNGFHPTFLVLYSVEGMMVVRVDDFEQGDRYGRDGISGAYLVIKDGIVTDQLNEGCDIDEQRYCVNDEGKRQYRLLENGKFQNLD